MNTNKLRVIIVEDEALITIIIKTLVKDMGDEVLATCRDSQCAFNKIKELKPDVIFMDINILGPLDGISVIQKLNLDYKPSVFYITAYSSPEIIEEAMLTKPRNLIVKPIREEDINVALHLARSTINHPNHITKEREVLTENIYYDYKKNELYKNNMIIKLTKLEKKLLEYLISKENEIISVDTLRIDLYNGDSLADSSIRDTISRFRKKVDGIRLETFFGKGYMFSKS